MNKGREGEGKECKTIININFSEACIPVAFFALCVRW